MTDWLQRAKRSAQRTLGWGVRETREPREAAPDFALDAVLERVQQLQPPTGAEPRHIHALIKLSPIPLPRDVRLEGHVVYSLAWLGTLVLALGGLWVQMEWLLWYGLLVVLGFALLFRLEGPRTRTERLLRVAQVEYTRTLYHEAEAHLQEVLHQRFEERVQDFHALHALYQAVSQTIEHVEGAPASEIRSAELLAAEVEALEVQMLDLVHELEGFSELYKQEIDAAIVACHDARLAYWQARLDVSVFTGEAVQHHT